MEDSSKFTDSAGVPWEGRSLQPNIHANDDGSADEKLLNALDGFRAGKTSVAEVVEVLKNARLLVPLVANLGEADVGQAGLKVDKSAELSIVTVRAPDGQLALPVFSSVAAMSFWNPAARPVPNNARTIALAAASEGNTRIVLDPMSQTEFVIRRPAIEAIAKGILWQSPEGNADVQRIVAQNLAKLDHVESYALASGDPSQRLQGQELSIEIFLRAGLQDTELKVIEAELFASLSVDEEFVSLVDSVSLRFLATN